MASSNRSTNAPARSQACPLSKSIAITSTRLGAPARSMKCSTACTACSPSTNVSKTSPNAARKASSAGWPTPPLRLDASHRFTSPVLRTVEDSVRALKVLPRRRGRGVDCAPLRASRRGLCPRPRTAAFFILRNQSTRRLALTCEAAPICVASKRKGRPCGRPFQICQI